MHIVFTVLRWTGWILLALWMLGYLLASITSRKPLSAIAWSALWTAHTALSFVGSALGFPIVGFLCLVGAWSMQKNAFGKPEWQWAPRWAWPWGNLEDGIDPAAVYPQASRAFKWCAWRNKVSNLRFTRYLGFQVDPKRVRFVGNHHSLYAPGSGWHLTWQGIYAGYWIRWKSGLQFRLGWTLVPDDALGFDPKNLRQLWCGFSVQLNRQAPTP